MSMFIPTKQRYFKDCLPGGLRFVDLYEGYPKQESVKPEVMKKYSFDAIAEVEVNAIWVPIGKTGELRTASVRLIRLIPYDDKD